MARMIVFLMLIVVFLAFLVTLFVALLMLTLVLVAMLLMGGFRMERNAIGAAQIAIGEAHIAPVTGGGQAQSMRGGRDIGVGQLVHVAMTFLVTLLMPFFVVLVVVLVLVFMVLVVMTFMHIEYGALGDFIILHVNVLIAVGQIQAAHMTAQREINRLAVVDRLGFGTHGAAETLEISCGDAVVHHIDNAADRAIGVHQRRRAANDLDLLDVIEADINGMVWTQRRDIADHRAVIQYFDAVAAHAADNRLADGRTKICRRDAKEHIQMLSQRLNACSSHGFTIQNVDGACSGRFVNADK